MTDALLRRLFPWQPGDIPGLAGLALAYAAATWLVYQYLQAEGVISMVWIPSGVGLAALLIGGPRYWPGILIGACAARLAWGQPLIENLPIGMSNVAEPLIACWLLHLRRGFNPKLERFQDYVWLALAGGTGAAVAASMGVGTLLLVSDLPGTAAAHALRLWWMGNFLGIVVVAPLLLVWRRPPQGWFDTGRTTETLAFLSLTFVCGQVVYLDWFDATLGPVARDYWVFLFIAWGAERYGRHGALFVTAAVAIQSLVGTPLGLGPLGDAPTEVQMINSWFHTVILTAVGLSLGLLSEGRRQALTEAEQAQTETAHLLSKTERSRRILLSVVEDQKAAETALRMERDRSQRYLDTVEAVIVALDKDGRVTLINRKGCALLGHAEPELLGRNWFQTCLPQPEGSGRIYLVFRQIMAGRLAGVEYFENEILTRGGERRLMAWHNSILRDPQGAIIGGLSAGEDITERREAEARLQAQLDELRRWRTATLGRETRVIDLKREVNALLGKQGEPPRYPSAVTEPGDKA